MLDIGEQIVRKVIPSFRKKENKNLFERGTIDLPRKLLINTFKKSGMIDPLESRKLDWDKVNGLKVWSLMLPALDDPSILFMKIFLSSANAQDSVLEDANEAYSQLLEKISGNIIAKQVVTKQSPTLTKELKDDIRGILTDITKNENASNKLQETMVEVFLKKIPIFFNLLKEEDAEKLKLDIKNLINGLNEVKSSFKDAKDTIKKLDELIK